MSAIPSGKPSTGDFNRSCVMGSRLRRALVTQLPVGQPGYQLGLHDRDVPDDRRGSVQHIPHRGECRGRIAFGQADHRTGVGDLAGRGPLVSQRREPGARLAGHPEAGLSGQQRARHLARQRVRTRHL